MANAKPKFREGSAVWDWIASQDPSQVSAFAPFRSTGDRVLIKPDPIPRQSKGGIIIPATARSSEPVRWGQALSCGARVERVKPGQRVCWPTHLGDFADGEQGYELMSLHESDIDLVVED